MVDLETEKLLTFFSNKFLYVHLTWIEQMLQKHIFSNNEQLEQQIMYLFLNSDIKTTLTSKSCLPENVLDLHNHILPGPYCLQVIQVQDIGMSILKQLEYLEQFDDSGCVKSLDSIKDDDSIEDGDLIDDNKKSTTTKKMIKLMLEDASGLCIWAIEYKSIEDISLKMNLGSKILLKNVLVLRGVLILDPLNFSFLGGHVFELNQNYFPRGLSYQLRYELNKNSKNMENT
ncbi:hypothetical protein PMAC_002015 [Pneumocystis sp. 'macacae']|nr:hypothetical protein PMAC_002015 [Pneumocystis sp. 'macacae']